MLVPKWSKAHNRLLYYPRLIDEKGRKRLYSPGHTSKKIAKEYEEKLRREIAERKMFPERFFSKRLFRDFVPEYLRKHASKKRSYRDYVSISKKLVAFFGESFLHEINRYQIATYYSSRAENVGVYMVNREITILKGILTKAIEWGFLSANPVKGFKMEKEEARSRFLSTREASKLVNACGKEPKASYLRVMVIMDLSTGLRKEELLSLRWEHIDLDRNVLKVEDGKGGYTRYVPINETARGQLYNLLAVKKGEFVFHDSYGRRMKDVKRSFGSAVERAGLNDVRFHDLRRTFGTWCAIRGVPSKTLQKWMGHKSIETTMNYYVVSPEDFEQEAIKRLDGAVDTYTDTSLKKDLGETPKTLEGVSEPCRSRTCDPLIKSQLLYQLS